MADKIKIMGAGHLPCAFCMRATRIVTAFFAALCILSPSVPPVTAVARELANVDSPAWCARRAPQAQAQCLRLETACRAAQPDMTSAGGCPSRELEACVARYDNDGSWCSILCCIEPENPACRAAANALPLELSTHK